MPTAHCARLVLSACLAYLPLVAGADCERDPECTDPKAWAGFTVATLRASSPDFPGFYQWRGKFDHARFDISIDVEVKTPKAEERGTVGLVGGRIMLSKGLKLEPGYEIDALDAPVLNMKLVMIVLSRVFPKGPDQVSGTRRVDRTDNLGIKYATPSASGYIPAPWRLKGKVTKLAGGGVTYDLALTFPIEPKGNKRKTTTMEMAGELGMLDRSVFLDTDLIDGWTTYGLGPREIKQGTSTILDYGASPDTSTSYKTIGDVRSFIAAESHPGTRDETKDFTGFWKEKCEEPFGLQIKPYGNDGKYSVVFCGPGGCGDPSEGRASFITGDKRWEVVSDDELVEIYRNGKRQTYRRCTRETNPVLKYR